MFKVSDIFLLRPCRLQTESHGLSLTVWAQLHGTWQGAVWMVSCDMRTVTISLGQVSGCRDVEGQGNMYMYVDVL